jgi:hypothetical protein
MDTLDVHHQVVGQIVPDIATHTFAAEGTSDRLLDVLPDLLLSPYRASLHLLP